MAKLIALGAAVTDNCLVHFNRTELTLLKNLYARRMAEREWRDYAIEHGALCAVFSVYCNNRERPALTVSKQTERGRPVYVVAQQEQEIIRCGALTDALAVLERVPRLVP